MQPRKRDENMWSFSRVPEYNWLKGAVLDKPVHIIRRTLEALPFVLNFMQKKKEANKISLNIANKYSRKKAVHA